MKNAFMISILTILFLHATAAMAQAPAPYQLVQFENDEFRDYTAAELTTLLGDDAKFLVNHSCDGNREYQLFTSLDVENPDLDSFRLVDAGNSTYIYRQGRIYSESGKEILASLKDAFINQAKSALAKLEQKPSSAKLLRELEKSRYRVYLALGGNRFDPREEGGRAGFGIQEAQVLIYFNSLRKADNILPFHQIGVGGFVRWNPNASVPALESDGVVRDTPVQIALAHELYHAYDSVRGLLDQRFVEGGPYEYQGVVEYRGVYFENQIRAESGLRFRKKYDGTGKDPISGEMLDAQGRPILIPAACLVKSI